MQFSEAKGPWRNIPAWADYLIRFGFRWFENEPGQRRIAVISMPCDSAGAGLVTLGAMRRRLGMKNASDLGCHFQRIKSLAVRGDAQTRLFNRNLRGRRRGPYILDGAVNDYSNAENMVWVELLNQSERRTISLANAFEWQFDGESPVSVIQGEKLPYEYIYKYLMDGDDQSIFPENLMQSDSYICLAGRVAGESETRDTLRKICFQSNSNSEVSLDKILSVQKWSSGEISRVKFFNSRNREIDSSPTLPGIVIIDGDTAFHKVEADDRFRESDIIAVIHRIIERDRLEAIGAKLESLSQWYVTDDSLIDSHSTVPLGITISILRRR